MRKTIEKTINKGLDTGKEVFSYPFAYPKKLTKLFIPEKQHITPLKRSMSGYETETFVLNNDGSIDNSDLILKKAERKKLDVKPECAKSMIEVLCLPHKKLSSTSTNLINNLIQLTELAEKNDQYLYPFATYPGTNKPVFRKKPWYTIKQKILGEKRFVNAGLCCGFHQHYALPRGMFNPKTKFLDYKINSKVKKTLLDSYNLLIAIDPILTCLLQSSPYTNNKYVAKDSRMVLYRGGKKLKYMKGLYATHQLFGALPPYKQTLHDLISTLTMRDKRWKQLLTKAGYNATKHTKENSRLDFCWNPVKVNPKGTLEYRGGDMNFLSMIFGVSTMMTFAPSSLARIAAIMPAIPPPTHKTSASTISSAYLFIPTSLLKIDKHNGHHLVLY